MEKTHWKKLQNPDYLGTYALDPGKDLVATIAYVRQEMVTGPDGKKENCSVVHFRENNIKPMILNVTNSKIIEKLFKTPYIEEWAGRAIQLYSAQVNAFGQMVDALRVREFHPKATGIDATCPDCGEKVTAAGKMTIQQVLDYTTRKYGKPICSECAAKLKAQKEQEDKESDILAKKDMPEEEAVTNEQEDEENESDEDHD